MTTIIPMPIISHGGNVSISLFISLVIAINILSIFPTVYCYIKLKREDRKFNFDNIMGVGIFPSTFFS